MAMSNGQLSLTVKKASDSRVCIDNVWDDSLKTGLAVTGQTVAMQKQNLPSTCDAICSTVPGNHRRPQRDATAIETISRPSNNESSSVPSRAVPSISGIEAASRNRNNFLEY